MQIPEPQLFSEGRQRARTSQDIVEDQKTTKVLLNFQDS